MNNALCVGLKIGDIPIRITTGDRQSLTFIKKAFKEYKTPASRACFSIHVACNELLTNVHNDADISVINDGTRILVISKYKHCKTVIGFIDRAKKCAELTIHPKLLRSFFHPFLMFAYVVFTAHKGVLVLHGAGVIDRGRGYIFLGPSGSGKTTVARLLKRKGVTIVSDERIVLRREKGEIYLYGFPWYNDKNYKAPLAAMFFLKQSKRVTFERVVFADALQKLFSMFNFIISDDAVAQAVLDNAACVCENTPAYTMQFLKDSSFWKHIKKLE
ncbi:hypothetical protein ACFL3D_05325 [Candidatus Omnitrophota bacterium]